jgi:DNA-binding NarL/FixJ family response regulator
MEFARKILVVDDEPIIRTLIAERLTQVGFETRHAPDALSAKREVLRFDPDALVVDLDLGDGPSGTELISALQELNPALGFVLLTNYTPTPAEMKSAKNLRYLSKREVADIDSIISALDSVLREGQSVITQVADSRLGSLTKGQLEVLGLLALGQSNQEIAASRGVGLRAVEQTIHRIYLALGISQEQGGSSRVTAARIYTSEMGLRRTRR